ncbi:MAG TPA: hypothetical protein VGL11_19295 [Candidatus Binatia bacterium]|jgi:hypothetical protein
MVDLRSNVNRSMALLAGGLFIFLLVASTPHRVHHLFDSDEAPKSCVVFTLSKGCHLNLTEPVNVFAVDIFVEKLFPSFEVLIPSRASLPFFQRAPPLN